MNTAAKTFSVLDRIATYQSQMPATMAKIAAVLIDDPKAPLNLSITELAERAGTSAASVTRFCRHDRLCRLLRASRRHRRRCRPRRRQGRLVSPISAARSGRTIRRMKSATRCSTPTCCRCRRRPGCSIFPTAVRVAKIIARSRHLDVYGVGGSALTALETEARLYRIGISVHAWSEIHDGLTSAAILDQHCVAIGISNTGRTEETIQMLTVAKASGAHTVAITGKPGFAPGEDRRRRARRRFAARLSAAGRSVGPALPAVRRRPALSARRAARFRPHDPPARRFGRGRGAAPPAVARRHLHPCRRPRVRAAERPTEPSEL